MGVFYDGSEMMHIKAEPIEGINSVASVLDRKSLSARDWKYEYPHASAEQLRAVAAEKRRARDQYAAAARILHREAKALDTVIRRMSPKKPSQLEKSAQYNAKLRAENKLIIGRALKVMKTHGVPMPEIERALGRTRLTLNAHNQP
jgi:hypothetical protein